MATLQSRKSQDNKEKQSNKPSESLESNKLNKFANEYNADQVEVKESKSLAENMIENKKDQRDREISKNNYAEILVRYKQMAGKQKNTHLVRSPKKTKAVTQSSNLQSEDQVQQFQTQFKNKIQSGKDPSIEKLAQKVEESGKIVVEGSKTSFKDGNRTYIKFLAQKQHEVAELNSVGNSKDKLQGMLQVKHILNTTKKSSSLPTIAKPVSSPIKMKKGGVKEKQVHQAIPQSLEQKGRSRILRIEKQRSLNSVAFLLTNIREKISQGQTKTKSLYKNYKISPSGKSTSGEQPFFSQISPRKTVNNKISLIEFSNNPSTLSLQQQKPSPKQASKQVNSKQPQKQTGNPAAEIDPMLSNLELKKTHKEKQMNAKLEQIKEDIQNENNEKEQLLKEHKTINKNLQISVLEKRQRITQLQAELNQYESFENNQNISNQNSQGEKLNLEQLHQQKLNKEKLFKEQKNKLKDQIAQIEKKIVQQQSKFNHLRSAEIQIKGEEMAEKEKQMQMKSKQMSEELHKKRKQLQEAIQKEKEKSKIYKLQLEEQSKKNAEISIELQKQEQLQQLLLDQIEKMVRQRRKKAQKKEEEKKKERNRLLEEIKQLEETESRLLMEYQRDSQTANNIFEAMRLKNLDLEEKLKKNRKEVTQVISFSD